MQADFTANQFFFCCVPQDERTTLYHTIYKYYGQRGNSEHFVRCQAIYAFFFTDFFRLTVFKTTDLSCKIFKKIFTHTLINKPCADCCMFE